MPIQARDQQGGIVTGPREGQFSRGRLVEREKGRDEGGFNLLGAKLAVEVS